MIRTDTQPSAEDDVPPMSGPAVYLRDRTALVKDSGSSHLTKD